MVPNHPLSPSLLPYRPCPLRHARSQYQRASPATPGRFNGSTAYKVQIRAHTKAGPGPFSPPLVRQTLTFETGRVRLRPSPPTHWLSFTSSLPLLWICHCTEWNVGQFLQVDPPSPPVHFSDADNSTVLGNMTTPHQSSPLTHSPILPSPSLHHQWKRAECEWMFAARALLITKPSGKSHGRTACNGEGKCSVWIKVKTLSDAVSTGKLLLSDRPPDTHSDAFADVLDY